MVCIAGEALRPPRLHSIHHPAINGVPTNRPTNQATTQPSQQPTKQPTNQATKATNKQTKSKQTTSQAGRTNQHTNQRKESKTERVGSPSSKQTKQPNVFPKCCRYLLCIGSPPSNQQTKQPKPHNPVFSQMLSILGSHCRIAGRRCALPRTPSRLYLRSIHPSIPPCIHLSINQAHKQKKVHVHQALYHASNQQQANQATNTPKSYIFLLVHDPSITVCVFPKTKQPTSQAGRTNQHTNQRKWGKKERVGSLPSHQQTKQPNGVFPKCCRYLLCIGSPPSNQQTKQPKPHNPVFSPTAVDIWLALQQASQPTNQHTKQRKGG